MTDDSMMRAARFVEVGQPLRVEHVPVPTIADDEVLVQVKAAGICGSDIHIALEGVTPTAYTPITLGHEVAGVIAGTGERVEDWTTGDRVAVSALLFDGSCRNCIEGHTEICVNRQLLGIHAEGGLAEFVAAPAKNLARLADNVPFAVGAAITDAVSTPFHALMDVAGLQASESVAIFGVGGLGLHAVQIAKLAGASPIVAVDLSARQRERAEEFGADVVIDPATSSPVEVIARHTGGHGVDLAAEFIGLQTTIAQATESLRIGGRAVICGLGPDPISVQPPTVFVRRQLALLGSYGFTPQGIQRVADLTAEGRLNLSGSITHTFPLDDVNEALRVLHEKVDDPVRVVVTLE